MLWKVFVRLVMQPHLGYTGNLSARCPTVSTGMKAAHRPHCQYRHCYTCNNVCSAYFVAYTTRIRPASESLVHLNTRWETSSQSPGHLLTTKARPQALTTSPYSLPKFSVWSYPIDRRERFSGAVVVGFADQTAKITVFLRSLAFFLVGIVIFHF